MLRYEMLFDISTMWPLYMLLAIWGVQAQLLLTAIAYESFKETRLPEVSHYLTQVKAFLSSFSQRQNASYPI